MFFLIYKERNFIMAYDKIPSTTKTGKPMLLAFAQELADRAEANNVTVVDSTGIKALISKVQATELKETDAKAAKESAEAILDTVNSDIKDAYTELQSSVKMAISEGTKVIKDFDHKSHLAWTGGDYNYTAPNTPPILEKVAEPGRKVFINWSAPGVDDTHSKADIYAVMDNNQGKLVLSTTMTQASFVADMEGDNVYNVIAQNAAGLSEPAVININVPA